MNSPANTTDLLLESLYVELRSMAQHQLREERPDHTLQATALVNEVYMKLRGEHETSGWSSRTHFMRAAAETMRRILVDSARAKLTQKRGSGRTRSELQPIPVELPLPPEEILGIHECLDQFSAEAPVKAELVKLRVFGGLTHQEAAEMLNLSRATADRYWAYAKARMMSLMS